MQINKLTIHNFRSIKDAEINLCDYSLMVGANNAGKSNIADAIRIFYEKDLKYERSRDFPKFNTDDKECWLEILFNLSDDEYANLKDEWRGKNKTLRVIKYLDTEKKDAQNKPKLGIYAYNQQKEIANELFYGAKNVQQGKVGEIIFIPAASKLDEHTKLTGPSALRELLNDILKKLVKTSNSFTKLGDEFQEFAKNIKKEETKDGRSLIGLEKDISDDINEWGAEFEININTVSETEIVKNLISYKIIDGALNEKMDASQFGQGFQRHLIFTLIRTAAKYQFPQTTSDKKEFKPDMLMLLFEEPEAFLHPMQQNSLRKSLRIISETFGQQVLISTHSPNFVSQNADDIPSIIHLQKESDKTEVGQIENSTLSKIFTANQEINTLLIGTKYESQADDLKKEMEAVKYFMWFNPERCSMFFAHNVILVEGQTEKVLFNYLFDTEKIEIPKGGIFVLDCLSKFNIHRFMNILGPLKIKHSVIYDADGGREPHEKIKKLIEDSRNDYTNKIDTFPEEIEDFLGIEKSATPYRKPQHVMLKIKEGLIDETKIILLTNKIQKLIE